jgi:hypothetical protein
MYTSYTLTAETSTLLRDSKITKRHREVGGLCLNMRVFPLCHQKTQGVAVAWPLRKVHIDTD